MTDAAGQLACDLGGGRAVYAYWFAARGHETPLHLERMLLTARDGIAHVVHLRWAYVAVTTERPSFTQSRKGALENFLADLYPLIQPES